MKTMRIIMIAAVAAIFFAACSSGGDTTSEPTGGGDTTSEPTTGGGTDATLTITAPAGASNSGFAETELSVPADEPFTIRFVNEDGGLPHNVQIFEGTDTTVTAAWAPEGNEMITGPAETVYEVPGLTAGTYTYNCFSHPATMVGTLTVS